MKLLPVVIATACIGFAIPAKAQITYSGTTSADAFLATGSADNPAGSELTGMNYGGAGTLVVAPAGSTDGEFQSVLRFSLTNALGLFDANFGPGNWSVTGIAIQLTSNYGAAGQKPNNGIFPIVSGGRFVIEWFSNDAWVEGIGTPSLLSTNGVTYDSLPDLLSGPVEILGTNLYVPPGDNVPVTYALPLSLNLLGAVYAGSDVNLLLCAADNQISYLFNSREYGRGNEPLILITAAEAQSRIVAGYFTNTSFHVAGLGVPNRQYVLQGSPDLSMTNWQNLGSATSDSSGMVQFDDGFATGQNRRFYRLSW